MKDKLQNNAQAEHVATTAILESLPISVIVVDKELNICLVNGFAQQLLGMSHIVLLHQNLKNLVDNDSVIISLIKKRDKSAHTCGVFHSRAPSMPGTPFPS